MPTEKVLKPVRTALESVQPRFESKAKPKDGEWLAEHEEAGQTFAEYYGSNPNRPTRTKTTIYIQPIGEFNETEQKMVDATVDLLRRFYNLPVKVLKPISLEKIPQSARRINRHTKKEQLLTTYILNKVLKPRRKKNAVAVLALTTTDLWPGEGWNFLFGQATFRDRVGVWSLARYGDPTESKEAYSRCLMRTLKIAIHETGHMFSIKHCTAYECGMNGSNSLPETDRGSLSFCPECSAKIWWACRVKPKKWYTNLIEFAKKYELKEEIALWEKCKAAL